MQGSTVQTVIEKALEGSQKIAITFKSDAIDYITFLWGMNNRGAISLEDDDILTTVSQRSYPWHNEEKRIFMVTLTRKFDKDMFIEQMSLGIDKIEAVN